ncbi:5'-deoxynucleotidase [Marinobacter sp. G11]|uniref:5'-deoxynucleotidase n=1 Tax=Marinobacter sp. G11 TaxID=2903522 RepID=UPI001E4A785F|nr:5'-deoxynucleotidase [Marinobacter sp. G11]MCE0760983.1 5'-deoxynucleotidase [Marinobacter sp. G11]
MTKQSAFLAWIFRMPLIKRWGLMHCVRPENVAEHSHQVAVIAHLLCVIRNERYGGNLDPAKAATLALFHEVSETKLQDQNHVVKYHNAEFTEQYKKLELLAEQECIDSLPADLQKHYKQLVIQEEVDSDYKQIVKAADIISAYLKVLDEQKFGNVAEFEGVRKSTEARIDAIKKNCPEVQDVLDVFVKSCLLPVDDISN